MKIHPGILLKSTEALNNTVFDKVIIVLTEHNDKGATGFVVNKPLGRSLNELEEFKNGAYFPLHNGGPVDQEHLFFLHRRPEFIAEGNAVGKGIYFGGNFKQAVTAINNKSISQADIKIFVGYCGWDAGELEKEIEEGSWTIIEGDIDAVFI